MKRFIITLITIFTMVTAAVVPASASAADTTHTTKQAQLTQEQEKSIEQGLTDLGVTKPTQEKLIKKLESGQLWDSLDHQKVAAVKDQLMVTPSHPFARYVFPDGSVIENGLTVPKQTASGSGIQPNLSGGTESCGTGYCNFSGVQVFRDDGIIKCYFYATYSIVAGAYNPDEINSVYSYNITNRTGSYSNPSLKILIPQEVVGTSGYAAQAELSFDWSA